MRDNARIVVLVTMFIGGISAAFGVHYVIQGIKNLDWTLALGLPLLIFGFYVLLFDNRVERFIYERIFPNDLGYYQARKEIERKNMEKLNDDDRRYRIRLQMVSFSAIIAVFIMAICIAKLSDFTLLDKELKYWQSAWIISTPLISYIIIIKFAHAVMNLLKKYPESGSMIIFPENWPRFERTVKVFGVGYTFMLIITIIFLILSCDRYMGETIVDDHVLQHILVSAPLLLTLIGIVIWFCIEFSFSDRNPRFET